MFYAIFLKDATNESRSIMSSKNKDHKMLTTEKMRVDKERPSFISKPIPVSLFSPSTSTGFSRMRMNANCTSHSALDMPPAEELVEYASFPIVVGFSSAAILNVALHVAF